MEKQIGIIIFENDKKIVYFRPRAHSFAVYRKSSGQLVLITQDRNGALSFARGE